MEDNKPKILQREEIKKVSYGSKEKEAEFNLAQAGEVLASTRPGFQYVGGWAMHMFACYLTNEVEFLFQPNLRLKPDENGVLRGVSEEMASKSWEYAKVPLKKVYRG